MPVFLQPFPHLILPSPSAEVLEGIKIEVVALASPVLQKGRLRQVLRVVNERMQLPDEQVKWSVEGEPLSLLSKCFCDTCWSAV